MKRKAHYGGQIVCYRAPHGNLPTYVGLGHRHLEKASPPPTHEGLSEHGLVSYRIPADLIRMTLPSVSMEEIVSVDLVYRK